MSHDWDRIAASEAFFGVLSEDKYRARELTPQRVAEFYATGDADVGWVMATFQRVFAAFPRPRAALDIGCGVGRLSRAMRAHVDTVTGFDVSETMLAIARTHAGEGVEYVSTLPTGSYDWVNSLMVLQHIQPEEGVRLLKAALATLAPGGVASIQVTAWKTDDAKRTFLAKLKESGRLALARGGARSAASLIQMHDYNLSEIIQIFVQAGMEEQRLVHTLHGRHHGVWIFARRAQ